MYNHFAKGGWKLYGWLLFSVLSASFYSILLHSYPANEKRNAFKLNFFASTVWIAVLFLSNRCTVHLTGEILLWGITYGITQALFVLFKAKAMNCGSVSATTLVGNASLPVSIIFSSIMWHERICLSDALGVALLLAAIYLSTYKKDGNIADRRWKLYSCIFFLLSAAVGIIFKGFGKSSVSAYTGDMLFVSAVVMTLFYGCVLLFARDITLPFSGKRFALYAVTAGLLSCLYNRLNVSLSASMDAVIFFPAFNGGVVVTSTLLGGLIYKERFTKKQISGYILAIVGILIIGIY